MNTKKIKIECKKADFPSIKYLFIFALKGSKFLLHCKCEQEEMMFSLWQTDTIHCNENVPNPY